MIKKLAIIYSVSFFILYSLLNYRLIFDSNRALVNIMISKTYPKWKLDFVLWEGADITANGGAAFEAMIVFKHYSLIELFASKVPEDKRKMMYELTLKYQLPEDIDKRLRKSLKINATKTTNQQG